MGTLFISEYTSDSQPAPTVGSEPAYVQQTVTTSAASAQSSAFGSATRLVRLHFKPAAAEGVSVRFGTNPTTATTSHARLAANQTEYFKVLPGNVVAAIDN